MMGDPWSDFEGGTVEIAEDDTVEPASSEEREKLQSLAEQLFLIEQDLETGREERRRCVLEIVGTCPDKGSVDYDLDDYVLEIERGERWHWDKSKLAQIIHEMGQEDAHLPNFVKRDIKVDREMFETASADDRARFETALNRGKGTTKVTVTKKGS